MKTDIILAGVGGQGILSIANVIGMAAIEAGLYIKQAEVHGMSQGGGDVQSNLRISDKEIASDLIPQGQCNMILSVEPMESLRYVPMLASDGWLVTNTKPFNNITNYPDIKDVLHEIHSISNNIAIDAEQLAKEIGSVRSANMVILGAASPFLGIEVELLKKSIAGVFKSKGEKIVNLNLKAFAVGEQIAKKKITDDKLS
ncbi:MAG: indolepyruvate oxidoreductase subunit beta [Bacteroidetes bacterium]|nr:MAG: indolepyruvate oxidoreductase subunit beta [Bacteroidota bacterium]